MLVLKINTTPDAIEISPVEEKVTTFMSFGVVVNQVVMNHIFQW